MRHAYYQSSNNFLNAKCFLNIKDVTLESTIVPKIGGCSHRSVCVCVYVQLYKLYSIVSADRWYLYLAPTYLCVMFRKLSTIIFRDTCFFFIQEVLYVGDHIFGDIIKSKKEQAFRYSISNHASDATTYVHVYLFIIFQDIFGYTRINIRD